MPADGFSGRLLTAGKHMATPLVSRNVRLLTNTWYQLVRGRSCTPVVLMPVKLVCTDNALVLPHWVMALFIPHTLRCRKGARMLVQWNGV
jgi:hypothetical protein